MAIQVCQSTIMSTLLTLSDAKRIVVRRRSRRETPKTFQFRCFAAIRRCCAALEQAMLAKPNVAKAVQQIGRSSPTLFGLRQQRATSQLELEQLAKRHAVEDEVKSKLERRHRFWNWNVTKNQNYFLFFVFFLKKKTKAKWIHLPIAAQSFNNANNRRLVATSANGKRE